METWTVKTAPTNKDVVRIMHSIDVKKRFRKNKKNVKKRKKRGKNLKKRLKT